MIRLPLTNQREMMPRSSFSMEKDESAFGRGGENTQRDEDEKILAIDFEGNGSLYWRPRKDAKTPMFFVKPKTSHRAGRQRRHESEKNLRRGGERREIIDRWKKAISTTPCDAGKKNPWAGKKR